MIRVRTQHRPSHCPLWRLVMHCISALCLLAVPSERGWTTHAQSSVCPERYDTAATACPLEPNSAVHGQLTESGQVHAYSFEAPAPGTRVVITLDQLPADYDLFLVDSDLGILQRSAANGTGAEHVEHLTAVRGPFYVYVVSDPGQRVDPARPYRLSLELEAPTTDVDEEPSDPTELPSAPPANRVLLADGFDDEASGMLPRGAREAAPYDSGYANGEYFIRIADQSVNAVDVRVSPVRYRDVTLGVDARLAGADSGRLIRLGCRAQRIGSPESQYTFIVRPDQGAVSIQRRDEDRSTALVDWRFSPAVRRGGEWNRLELSCVGDRITGYVNGTEVASARDARYGEGFLTIETGKLLGTQGEVEARFDNLVVTAG